jgi:hypothetical protein
MTEKCSFNLPHQTRIRSEEARPRLMNLHQASWHAMAKQFRKPIMFPQSSGGAVNQVRRIDG